MPIFDTPIISDEKNLEKILAQKLPVVLVLHAGEVDKPLQDALNKEAKKNEGKLLVVRVDAKENPQVAKKYGSPSMPALISLTENNFGRKQKAKAETIRPKDLRVHIAHLLDDEPLPELTVAKGGKPFAVSDATFRNEVLKSKTPVLVDFWANWCGPCHQIAPHVEKIAAEYGDKLKVVKLDIDANQVTAQRYGIQSIPTLLLFEDGQIADRTVGANPVGLRKMVERHV